VSLIPAEVEIDVRALVEPTSVISKRFLTVKNTFIREYRSQNTQALQALRVFDQMA
jgi:hypothetical protein